MTTNRIIRFRGAVWRRTFCGHSGGRVLYCPPGKCRRLGRFCLYSEIHTVVENYREDLQRLLEQILRDCGPLTLDGVLAVGTNRFGGEIGALLCLLAAQEVQS